MFDELLEVTREFLKKVITSRLFALAVIFTLMFIGLICKLFRMQILDGSSYQESYMQRTEKLVTTPGTRGNIYDRNGNLLAYNQLAYSVTINLSTVENSITTDKRSEKNAALNDLPSCDDPGTPWGKDRRKAGDRLR